VIPLPSLWSRELSTQDRHYTFEVRQLPSRAERYLTITQESILNGRRQRVALTIRHADISRFVESLLDAASFLS
jgi:hypothetical protein